MAAEQPQDKYVLRLPDGMRDRLKVAAAEKNRSMNAEIVARLDASFASREELLRLFSQMIAAAIDDHLEELRVPDAPQLTQVLDEIIKPETPDKAAWELATRARAQLDSALSTALTRMRGGSMISSLPSDLAERIGRAAKVSRRDVADEIIARLEGSLSKKQEAQVAFAQMIAGELDQLLDRTGLAVEATLLPTLHKIGAWGTSEEEAVHLLSKARIAVSDALNKAVETTWTGAIDEVLPPQLADRIYHAAEGARRSFADEVIHALEKVYPPPPPVSDFFHRWIEPLATETDPGKLDSMIAKANAEAAHYWPGMKLAFSREGTEVTFKAEKPKK